MKKNTTKRQRRRLMNIRRMEGRAAIATLYHPHFLVKRSDYGPPRPWRNVSQRFWLPPYKEGDSDG